MKPGGGVVCDRAWWRLESVDWRQTMKTLLAILSGVVLGTVAALLLSARRVVRSE